MNTLYTASALATGTGRNGHTRSSDGRVDLSLAAPKELGGSGDGANPEQLFAAGYAACFHSALQLVARQAKTDLGDSSVGAQVGLGANDEGGFGLAVTLEVVVPDPSVRGGPGDRGGGPPGVPLLQRHPRQHRGHAQRRRRLSWAASPRATSARRTPTSSPWPAGHGSPRPTPAGGRGRPSRRSSSSSRSGPGTFSEDTSVESNSVAVRVYVGHVEAKLITRST